MTARFENGDQMAKAQERIERLCGRSPAPLVEACFESCADPDRAMLNLEKLLAAMASPASGLEHLLAQPEMAELLIQLLGASSQIGQVLVQNPELASLILDPSELARPMSVESITQRGRSLLASADSYAHRLDRLRFLKQKSMLRCAANELTGIWPPEVVWRALSDTADAVVTLALEIVWNDYAVQRGIEDECPITVIGFGKLGGRELNYSSDIDLVFAIDDDASEKLEREAQRASEKLIRAMTDEMGRGRLYRVDMRLRPFGRSGALASRFRALESYMEKYAEPWEHMALIRSRPMGASLEIEVRWEKLRERVAFRKSRGAWAIESILEMKARTEQSSSDLDIKRGVGGIRDAEFSVQLRQLLLGHQDEQLRQASTLGALARLEELGYCDPEEATVLREGLQFFRRLEHLLQIDGDRQVHELPQEDAAFNRLAWLMGLDDAEHLLQAIEKHRTGIRRAYEALGASLVSGEDEQVRERALHTLSPHEKEIGEWFDALESSAAFYQGLLENESSVARVRRVLEASPMLVTPLRNSVTMTEQLMSGEVLEGFAPSSRIVKAASRGIGPLAKALSRGRLRAALRWVLSEGQDFWPTWSDQVAESLRQVIAGYPGIQMAFLGSLARREMGWDSDADLILAAVDDERKEAESQARQFVAELKEARQKGWPFELDMRLRPEGKSGPLVFTRSQFDAYTQSRIEPWEVMALRFMRAAQEDSVFAGLRVPSRWEDADWRGQLFHIKERVERELAKPGLDLKLGPGGLDDIQWIVGLGLLAHPDLQPDALDVPTLLRLLAGEGWIESTEAEFLAETAQHFLAIRLQLELLGEDSRVLPTEPAKLEVLSIVMNDGPGEHFAKRLEGQTERVRSLFEQVRARAIRL